FLLVLITAGLSLDAFGFLPFTLPHQLTDLPGRGICLRSQSVRAGLDLPALFIKRNHFVYQPGLSKIPDAQPLDDMLTVFTDIANLQHSFYVIICFSLLMKLSWFDHSIM